MDLGEQIAVGGLAEELESECPLKEDALGVDKVQPENAKNDDRKQPSNGGILGRNLMRGSNGADGTVGGPYPPPEAQVVERRDTKRKGVRVRVPGTDSIPEGEYGFTLSAHHLIPGKASLEVSDLKHYMTKDDQVEVKTADGPKMMDIRKHIGYNVNGTHNGVWLPGNYYIRSATSPVKGTTWSLLGDNPWCLNYVAAVTKAAGGQFHDTHVKYSAAVKDLLNKIAERLSKHQCEHCPKEYKDGKINPPFRIKNRLYRLSEYFRDQVTGEDPKKWKRSWFTSDRWRDHAFLKDEPSQDFETAYKKAIVIMPSDL